MGLKFFLKNTACVESEDCALYSRAKRHYI